MATQTLADKTVCVGAFNTVAKADRAVREALEAGFSREQVGVVCSAACRKEFFPEVPASDIGETGAPGRAIAAGGLVGGAIGGLALAVTAAVTGGAALLAAGSVLVAGGAIAGSFAGLMSTLGYDAKAVAHLEKEVREGKILVTVHDFPPDSNHTLAIAQRIMEEAGAGDVVWIAERV
ncbi:MAG: hypothetical protein U0793_29605 [Gemmataceae bacterium]